MTQPDVSLTDYGLAVECVCFTSLVARLPKAPPTLRFAFMAFFFSIALAATAGGSVHGFFLDESSMGNRILWPFTLIAMGVTALSGYYIGSGLQFPLSTGKLVNRAGLAIFALYALLVLFVRRDFRIAIINHVPPLVFIGIAFLLTYYSGKKPAFLVGFLGVCTMLIAAALQQARIGLNERYFGYNALYHVLQAFSLFMIFVAARESAGFEEIVK
jgi:hypothetical protein